MSRQSVARTGGRWLAAGAGVAAGAYAAYVCATWARYGSPSRHAAGKEDSLLDRFMPVYDVVGRQHRHIGSPAAVTLAAAREMNLLDTPVARLIFRGRELILGATPDHQQRPRGLLNHVQSMGWRILAEIPGREIVVGAVTKPWEANPTFRGLPADQFAAFAEPDYVKIVWNLRADPVGRESVFRTETRAVATDAAARSKFRLYWSFFSPGMALIRWASFGGLAKLAHQKSVPR